jgi:HK97 gp10 family phage protein
MPYTFNVRGMENFKKRLRELPEKAQREVKFELEHGARRVQADAVSMVPVRTGNLRKILASPGAVRIRKRGLQVVFGITGVKAARDGFYARFIEFGTKGYQAGQRRRSGTDKQGRVQTRRLKRNVPPRAARPFMRPAFMKNLPKLQRRLRAAIRRALKHR